VIPKSAFSKKGTQIILIFLMITFNQGDQANLRTKKVAACLLRL